ncbi:uncharacterized protein Z518_10212 [Rhinocladiella mackenziei CBS 650.93]|uniref:Uncharacterized protein n=1 Tax=Rhinocladiella mackenziei CBS 650.93 TaxID=1442369 RepID=A0A0D2ID36_9EURO|nr:uncharacterized protein Z518_10212 [Rhinocladiella mackenziei CBS 650.93]KIX01146.1 hypothetical protein Z518_10212 [Rhinocladiella mackenziei CBS 650.93]
MFPQGSRSDVFSKDYGSRNRVAKGVQFYDWSRWQQELVDGILFENATPGVREFENLSLRRPLEYYGDRDFMNEVQFLGALGYTMGQVVNNPPCSKCEAGVTGRNQTEPVFPECVSVMARDDMDPHSTSTRWLLAGHCATCALRGQKCSLQRVHRNSQASSQRGAVKREVKQDSGGGFDTPPVRRVQHGFEVPDDEEVRHRGTKEVGFGGRHRGIFSPGAEDRYPEMIVRGPSGEPLFIQMPDVDYGNAQVRNAILQQLAYISGQLFRNPNVSLRSPTGFQWQASSEPNRRSAGRSFDPAPALTPPRRESVYEPGSMAAQAMENMEREASQSRSRQGTTTPGPWDMRDSNAGLASSPMASSQAFGGQRVQRSIESGAQHGGVQRGGSQRGGSQRGGSLQSPRGRGSSTHGLSPRGQRGGASFSNDSRDSYNLRKR